MQMKKVEMNEIKRKKLRKEDTGESESKKTEEAFKKKVKR